MWKWRDDIRSALAIVETAAMSVGETPGDRWVQWLVGVLPLGLLTLLLLATTGIIQAGSSAHIVSVHPAESSIESVNDVGGRIEVTFNQPMSSNYYRQTSIQSEAGDLDVAVNWQDEDTLVIEVSRTMVAGEKVAVKLWDFRDHEDRPLSDRLDLVYQ